MSIVSIIIPALLLDYFVRNYLTNIPSNIVTFTVIILAVIIFPPIKNYYYRLANKYFFSSLYDARQVIAELSEKLRSTLDIARIYDYVSDTLVGAFHAKAAGLLTYDEESGKYMARYSTGFAVKGREKFAGNTFLHNEFIAKNHSIVAEELRSDRRPEVAETLKLLSKMGVEILTPLNIKDKTIGLIALGPKESGDMYNDEDLQVLEIVGAQTAIAMENALLYDETRKFNINLKKEVERATSDLRHANDQLKKLDQAKSDFISIASHQLRTPLTVIKGYVSMILEGNFGDLNPAERNSLDIVFQSNERLIRLVENLLNISRIESGRLQYSLTTVPLSKVTDSVVEELSNYIKKKGLKFIYKKPAALPFVKIDEEKIRQVVLNLIDNSVKYTKQGSITVSLKESDGQIVFTVSDSGLGIKPEDLPNLFKKFSRGTGTSLVHTEGTGLGLYVARMMIEAHNGKIWAESDGEGRGSRFMFSLPVNTDK
jgi:signal transduction histidine kinase